jgi:hypothetical protein
MLSRDILLQYALLTQPSLLLLLLLLLPLQAVDRNAAAA